ncbi:hypothetical protein KIH74_10870 [Kineosporia sp. J2-2]|uniref:Uncharacterized protein n=1 Tax=Kineosporia corallincola TaxID=2835133 RepID=A0ABS5TGB8_9ACTN|nr:hypothetical protein [Kineosporia corallincola]MBT0769424.1 hypothetical protein [Kineosporia corallincola]
MRDRWELYLAWRRRVAMNRTKDVLSRAAVFATVMAILQWFWSGSFWSSFFLVAFTTLLASTVHALTWSPPDATDPRALDETHQDQGNSIPSARNGLPR